MGTALVAWLEIALGVLVWCSVLWDGFATIVLPRTVAPMRRISGRFSKWSWWLWAAVGRRIGPPGLRLSFLAVYGPLSVMILLVLWGGLIILAFTLIYQGLGPRFQSTAGRVDFGTLLYMSGSTFLTLGLGDVTSADPLGRLFILLEAGTGYTFLALIVTYMPLLDQAYSAREVVSLLIQSRTGHPPGAIGLLRRYAGADRSDLLRGSLRDAERWIAETLESHLSHPVLAFYRAQRMGESWLVALTAVLDSSALLIVGGDGLLAAQARLTYLIGVRLLEDLTAALGIHVDPQSPGRLNEADLPALARDAEASALSLNLGPSALEELLRLVRRYDVYCVTLAGSMLVTLPSWLPPPPPTGPERETSADSSGPRPGPPV
jgi:hypothetical protein